NQVQTHTRQIRNAIGYDRNRRKIEVVVKIQSGRLPYDQIDILPEQNPGDAPAWIVEDWDSDSEIRFQTIIDRRKSIRGRPTGDTRGGRRIGRSFLAVQI